MFCSLKMHMKKNLVLKYYFGPNSNASEVVWKLETQRENIVNIIALLSFTIFFSPLDLIYSSFSL